MFGFKERERKRQDDEFANLDESPLSTLVNDQAELSERQYQRRRGVGGTSGGFLEFFMGLGMTIGGGYLITQQVTVSSGYWNMFGQYTFGLTLIPLLIGIGMLFFNGRSMLGRLMTFGGAIIILFGIIANLHIYFAATSLFNTLIMFTLLAGGLGLVARSLRPHDKN